MILAAESFSGLRPVLEAAGVRYALGPEQFLLTDPEEARAAIDRGRPFNVICMPMAFQFDFFPARAFPPGKKRGKAAGRGVAATGVRDRADALPT